MSFENVDKLRRMTMDNNGRRQTTQPAYPRSFPWPRLRWQLTANSHSKIFFRKAHINLLACFLYQGLNIWNKENHKATKFWLRIFVNSELLFYSILSHNLGRSSEHHRWICNNPFPSWPVFSCPSWAGKVHSCPLFDIVFPPPLLLSASFSFSFHCAL